MHGSVALTTCWMGLRPLQSSSPNARGLTAPVEAIAVAPAPWMPAARRASVAAGVRRRAGRRRADEERDMVQTPPHSQWRRILSPDLVLGKARERCEGSIVRAGTGVSA